MSWGGVHRSYTKASYSLWSLECVVVLYISAKHVLENFRNSASGSSSSVFPEMCNLLYSTCHVFVHRCILNS